MNQIPGSVIAIIFFIALVTVVSNETLVSSVSNVPLDATSEDFATVSHNKKEEKELKSQSLYDLPETARDNSLGIRKVPKCLVNLHIPKVGGRTVGTFLQQVTNVTGFERYPLYGHKGEQNWEDIVQAKRTRRIHKKHDDSADNNDSKDSTTTTTTSNNNNEYYDSFFVQGHFTARIFDTYPELKECLIMTVLRQPVDRAISAFFFHNHRRYEIDKCLSSENYDPLRNSTGDDAGDANRHHQEEEEPPGMVIQRGNATTILMSSTMTSQKDDLEVGAKSRLALARMNAQKLRNSNRRSGGGNQRCKLFWQYSNDMTLRFAGLPELPWKSWEMSERGRKWRKDKNMHQAFEKARLQNLFSVSSIPQANETHLERAKANMKNYVSLVCFLHDLPSCAKRILQAFQLDVGNDSSSEIIDLSIMSANRTLTTKFKTKSRPDQLEEKELQKFQEANRFDQALYDWALEQYSSQ
ncbi:unnamed protein product [Cylindrotheca closterium]|uniref:Sulfotransferase domain-containing protein n=1 Tax=Cylindrotheca closterium TaxID=2856 RepID=A0AAD2PVL8_9STRA|nr:unnamed protein product [Cylindrotheca closterium]